MMEGELNAQAKVMPQWLPGGDSFWYKHEASRGRFEFVFVDALNRTRQGGLEHIALARHLQRLTGRTADPESVLAADPEDWKGPLDNDNMKGRWLRRETPSPFAARKVTARFVNNGRGPLTMQWIDHSGEPIYRGTIEAGNSKRTITYAGHVWRFADKDTGVSRAVYAAPKDEEEDVAVIDNDPVREHKGTGGEMEHSGASKINKEATAFPKVFVRDLHVWIAYKDGDERQVTKNATKDDPYDEDRVYMSPDKRHAVVWQYVPEQERKVYLIESSPADQLQPRLKTIQYLKPGDRVRVDRPRLFNLERGSEVPTDNQLFENPYDLVNIGWDKDGREYRFIFNERGHQHLRVIGMNQDGRVHTLVEESSKSFIDYSSKLYWNAMNETGELLWASERDGWNHIYLYDLERGLLKNQVTKGRWLVRSVERVDEAARRLWFCGYGMVDGQDPYYAQLARISFDGSGLKILTEGDGTHAWKWSPDKRYLIDTWSRIDCPPTTVLRDGETGEKILILQETRFPDPLPSGWSCAERFAAPGRDGTTMIYGIIVRPSHFDPTGKYPVLEDIYAGPQGSWTPKAFSSIITMSFREWADKGYVVVRLDGMGTNWRSKAFHDVCYKQLQDAGFPDRIAWIRAAAATRPWMDASRVGIKGASAGGQNAGAALLFHGDFYSVAAADSGCHDNRMDKIWWNEQFMGWPVDESYEHASNAANAARLRGKLMLIVGDLDDNVDPSSTLQFASALDKAQKEYELVFIPGGKHGCGSSIHGSKKQTAFFRRYLLES